MKKIFILITSILFSQFVLAEENYLEKPTGKYEVGFQDFRLVNGTLINGIYSCPGKTDLLYIPDTPEKSGNKSDFGIDNQTDFCRESMVRVYYPTKNNSKSSYENYYGPAINSKCKHSWSHRKRYSGIERN